MFKQHTNTNNHSMSKHFLHKPYSLKLGVIIYLIYPNTGREFFGNSSPGELGVTS